MMFGRLEFGYLCSPEMPLTPFLCLAVVQGEKTGEKKKNKVFAATKKERPEGCTLLDQISY